MGQALDKTFPSRLVDWLSWQESIHPEDIELGLDRIAAVAARLSISLDNIYLIIVGGTNGKGSTVAFLENILQAAGYRTASYTSPWITSILETVRYNLKPIGEKDLCEGFKQVECARRKTRQETKQDILLTAFEHRTLAAVKVLTMKKPDFLILEVGLGGRLDAVNIFPADLSIITNISKDHMQWLGHSFAQIAREKAGIMRAAKPTVFADRTANSDILTTLQSEADSKGSEFIVAGKDYSWRQQEDGRFADSVPGATEIASKEGAVNGTESQYKKYWILENGNAVRSLPYPTFGSEYQLANAASAVIAIEILVEYSDEALEVSHDAIIEGISSTTVMGRLQLQRYQSKQLLLDVAHNEAACKALAEFIRHYMGSTQQASARVYACTSMYNDKEIEQCYASLADCIDSWHLVPMDNPRSSSIDRLMRAVSSFGSHVSSHGNTEKAMDTILPRMLQHDLLVIFGSFEMVKNAYKFMNNRSGGDNWCNN